MSGSFSAKSIAGYTACIENFSKSAERYTKGSIERKDLLCCIRRLGETVIAIYPMLDRKERRMALPDVTEVAAILKERKWFGSRMLRLKSEHLALFTFYKKTFWRIKHHFEK